MRILSLGAGVQSTAMLLMSLRGDLPRPDHAIFADTQDEPASVYRHLEWLKAECVAAGLPLHIVTKGRLLEAATDVRRSAKSGNTYVKTNLPVWVRSADGSLGLNRRRQCTSDFKLVPIYSWVWKNIARVNRSVRVEMWMGISADERQRMRGSPRKYVEHVYPFCSPAYTGSGRLLWRSLTRTGCNEWLAAHYPGRTIPRSACRYCPYHKNEEWRRLRDDEPEEFAKAIENEQAIQRAWSDATALDGTPYLHRSGVPLSLAQLDDAPVEEDLFGMRNECVGMCGV